jgi:hypothetical protein
MDEFEFIKDGDPLTDAQRYELSVMKNVMRNLLRECKNAGVCPWCTLFNIANAVKASMDAGEIEHSPTHIH